MTEGPDQGSGGQWNAAWCGAFLEELALAGVREIFVAPGSRSTPLVLAAAGNPRFRVISVVDERSAGFLALGVGKSARRPAAVITTSGTAAANLYPAVIEASQGEWPMLVLTADRPHRLRDTDGNQSMDQLRLFGPYPRAFFEVEPPRPFGPAFRHLRALAARAVSRALGPPAGPVHLNFPFEKPLEPQTPGQDFPGGQAPDIASEEYPRAASGPRSGFGYTRVISGRPQISSEEVDRLAAALVGAERGLIVAGLNPDPERIGPAVLELGAATGFPVLADPLSGSRFGPPRGARVVGGYDLFLRSPEVRAALEPDLILRVGGSPTSAALMGFLAQHAGVRQIVVDDGLRWKDHLAVAHEYLMASPGPLLTRLSEALQGNPERGPRSAGWTERWEDAESRTRRVLNERDGGELLEGDILSTVVKTIPAGANLLVASSMPIRDLDAFVFPGSKPLAVFGNRGVSGIDGLVSTTLGLAVGSWDGEGHTGDSRDQLPTVGVLGDLAFYHDMNGLLAVRDLGLPVVFVIINNDGGGIFETLPVRNHEPAFTRYFSTPHGLDFRQAAELYELPYARAETLQQLEAELTRALGRGEPGIVEVRTRRVETHQARRLLVETVTDAMAGLGQD